MIRILFLMFSLIIICGCRHKFEIPKGYVIYKGAFTGDFSITTDEVGGGKTLCAYDSDLKKAIDKCKELQKKLNKH